MNKNDIITLTVTATSSEGVGIGRYDGLAVFVPNAAEGDEIKARILKVKKNLAYGKIEEILTPSLDRISPDCAVSQKCGGCVYRHITYKKECEIKENMVRNNINRLGGVALEPQPIMAAEEIFGYRNKAQLPISKGGKTGFFAHHSHRIVETSDCLLTPEIFNEISKVFEGWIKEYNVPPYCEENGKGLLRHLYMRIAKATGEIMVVAVINGDKLPHSEELIIGLKELLGDKLKGVLININRQNTNVILGDKCETLYGDNYITDILCALKIRINPLSFYQINRDMTEKLYKKAAEYLKPDGKNIIDLYCGAGTIGLSMAEKAKSIIGVEIIPEAVADAKINAEQNGITNAEFICGDATYAAKELLHRGITADAVILDPPRKGCTEELLKTVANDFSPEKIVYISCDSATLARDTKILTTLGYNLMEYTPVDLFPRTHHVETVALLSRQKVDEHIYLDVNVQDLPKTTRTTATYPEIKAYIKDKYGLNVTSLNIAQIKEKHGFEKRENYNKGKEGHRVPNCPPEKEKAIEDAFKHFGML